jgi:hypothetical protein
MQADNSQNLIAADVPIWLTEYGNKLNWNNQLVATTARAQVKKYMLSLPQKNYAWQQRGAITFTGAIPPDVLSDISSVNWNAVPQIVQSGMKALLPSL